MAEETALPIRLEVESLPRANFPLESSQPALCQAARKTMLLAKHKRSTIKRSPACREPGVQGRGSRASSPIGSVPAPVIWGYKYNNNL